MLIALSGPSGSGKGYVKKAAFTSHPMLSELRWLTTRPLRDDEVRGGNRVSVSATRFEALVAREKCVLVQGLYGNRYAVLKHEFLDVSRPRITEIHPGNAEEAVSIRPDIFLIGLVTDDYSLLRERIAKRGGDGLDARVAAAEAEVALLRDVQHLYHAVFSVSRETEATLCEDVCKMIGVLLKTHTTNGGG